MCRSWGNVVLSHLHSRLTAHTHDDDDGVDDGITYYYFFPLSCPRCTDDTSCTDRSNFGLGLCYVYRDHPSSAANSRTCTLNTKFREQGKLFFMYTRAHFLSLSFARVCEPTATTTTTTFEDHDDTRCRYRKDLLGSHDFDGHHWTILEGAGERQRNCWYSDDHEEVGRAGAAAARAHRRDIADQLRERVSALQHHRGADDGYAAHSPEPSLPRRTSRKTPWTITRCRHLQCGQPTCANQSRGLRRQRPQRALASLPPIAAALVVDVPPGRRDPKKKCTA